MINTLTELADRQWRDYLAREPGTCFADPSFILDLPQAYALQDAVSALRVAAGDRVIGYKIGCTGPGTVAQFGMEGPIRGRLFESEVRRSGDTLDSANFACLAIEGEMALRVGENGRIEAAFPAIELHHFVFRKAGKTLVELVANNGLNAGIVLPEEKWLASGSRIAVSGVLSVRVNDRVLGLANLWPLPGGGAASLEWLQSHLAKFGIAPLSGQIVLAGTTLGLYPVKPGDHIAVCIDGESAADCSIV